MRKPVASIKDFLCLRVLILKVWRKLLAMTRVTKSKRNHLLLTLSSQLFCRKKRQLNHLKPNPPYSLISICPQHLHRHHKRLKRHRHHRQRHIHKSSQSQKQRIPTLILVSKTRVPYYRNKTSKSAFWQYSSTRSTVRSHNWKMTVWIFHRSLSKRREGRLKRVSARTMSKLKDSIHRYRIHSNYMNQNNTKSSNY